MKREKSKKSVSTVRGKIFKIPFWQKVLVLTATVMFLSSNMVAHASVLKHDRHDRHIPQGQDQTLWQTRLAKGNAASGNLVEFDKSQFSLLQEALGDVSIEGLQLTTLTPNNNGGSHQNGQQGIMSLNATLLLDSLSNSATLRTIYFDSRQLRFNFKLSLMNLIGDDLVKEELAENRRRQIENANRPGTSYTPNSKPVKSFGENNLLADLGENIKSLLAIILAALLSVYLILRFFRNKI